MPSPATRTINSRLSMEMVIRSPKLFINTKNNRKFTVDDNQDYNLKKSVWDDYLDIN